MQIYSLHQINEFTRRVLALNLPEPVWLQAETIQVSESRGHFFIELVENADTGEEVIAQASAILWQNSYRRIRRQRGRTIRDILRAGLELRLQVQVDFHERFGYRLIVTDIDPNFTLGQVAQQRELNLQQLQAEKAIGRNGKIPLRPVLQKLAIISSPNAAGYADFMNQLGENEYAYQFHSQLFPAAMQGQSAPGEIIAQLEQLTKKVKTYDAIVLIRGGGAKLDLAAFDDLALCQKIARMEIPLISGIGHETDESLVDLVAHTALKTPTAVADFLIDQSLQFELKINDLALKMQRQVQNRIQLAELGLTSLLQRIQLLTEYYLKNKNNELTQLEKSLQQMDPRTILARGYVLLEKDYRSISRLSDLSVNDQVELIFQDGTAKATINHLNSKPN